MKTCALAAATALVFIPEANQEEAVHRKSTQQGVRMNRVSESIAS